MDEFSLKNIVDEVHILNESTFISEFLTQKPLPSTNPFSQNINFEYDTIRVAPYGGSIAILHSTFSQNLTTTISIYDPLLNFLRNIELTESIQDFYLTADEVLVVIFNTPAIGVYDQRGKLILYKELSSQKEFIVASSFWEHGIMISTFAGNVYLVYDFSKLQITKFATDEQYIPNITSSLVLPPKSGVHGPIFWGIRPDPSKKQTELVCVQKNRVKAIVFDDVILRAQYSSDFSMVMVLTPSSVDICDEYFRGRILKIGIQDMKVSNACWCGSSTVLLTTKDGLKMVGQSNTSISFNLLSDCCAFTDVDGARVVTSNKVVYIREVSGTCLDFINNNSKSPSIHLYNIVSHPKDFATSDPLESLRDVMDQAINGILEAALFFRNPVFVKTLLRIVTRYKGECKNYKSEQYQNAVTYNRIISHLSEEPSNMPLTVTQVVSIGNDRLLVRLCNRYLHFLAFKVADYLNSGVELVSSHCAHCLVSSGAPNGEILARLENIDNAIDRVELAASCFNLSERSSDEHFKQQKENLAILLLKTVPAKSRAVPLLIQRGQWAEAVEASVDSNDSSLLVFVLKSATEQRQDWVVRDCITKHLIALDGWLKLHPEEPQKAELLQKSGLLRDALLTKFQEGEKPDKLAQIAKENNDPLDLDFFQQLAAVRNACNTFGIQYDEKMTAYDAFDKIVELRKPNTLKQAAKMLRLQPDEVITRRLVVAEKTGQEELINEAAKDASQEVLYFTFLNLMDDGKTEMAMKIQNFINKDDYLGLMVQKRLEE